MRSLPVGTAFPRQKHVHRTVFEALNQREHLLHGRTFANNAVKMVVGLDLLLQAPDLGAQVFFLQRSLDQQQQVGALKGLGQVVKRPQPHGLDRTLDRPEGRDHDHRQTGLALLGAAQDLHPLHAVQHQVGNQEIGVALLERCQRVWPLLIRLGGVAGVGQEVDEPGAHLTIIVQH